MPGFNFGPSGAGSVAAYKSANEALTASATLQTDDHLSVTVVAGRRYQFEAVVLFSAGLGGIKAGIGGTATATNFRAGAIATESGTVTSAGQLSALDATLSGGASVDGHYVFQGAIEVNAGGTLAVRWAQGTSNAAATTVLRGSTLRIWEV